jgi:polysaccharide biosynthesis transport protein
MVGDSLTRFRSAPPLPTSPEPGPPPEWWRYLTAVRQFRWLVLGVTLTVTALGVVGALLLPPNYAAQATIWIQVPNRELRNEGPIWQGQLPISSGWMELLQSYAVLDDAVRSQRLYLIPKEPADSDALAGLRIKERVVPGTYRLVVDDTGSGVTLFVDPSREPADRGQAGDSVGARLGLSWVPPMAVLTPKRTIEFVIKPPYEAALKLAHDLKVTADLDGNFLRMELEGPSAAGVAGTVNAVAERFVVVAASLKRDRLAELTTILGTQLTRAQGNVRSAEEALRAFRVSAVTTLAVGAGAVAENPSTQYQRDPLFAGLVEMKVSLDDLARDRAAIERLLRQAADSGLSVDALAMVGAVQRSTQLVQALRDLTEKQAELRALRSHYTDENPPVRRLASEVSDLARRTIPGLASSLAAELRVRETELAQRVDAASAGLQKVPPLAVEEGRRQRDVTLAEQALANLQQRYEEARLAEVSSIPDVRLLDRAVEPQNPVGHAKLILVLLAVIGGLGLGAGGAVLLDSTDRRVRYPDQVTRAMGLTILGAVPRVEWRNGKRETAAAQVIEALRGVRLNVVHRHGSAGPVRLTVTSPGKSDGKSFVASNLALAFADAGFRTLLVDGDVRRGRLHHTLAVARRPGLTELLEGSVTWDQVLQSTRYNNLSFIACGLRSQAGPALLSSVTMARLLDGVRSRYEAIIVDSPPLAAGADALALATVTGSLLLVLRAGVSDRELTETKLGVLTHLPVRLLGAVLNDVRPGGAYRYYSYYLEGYEMHDEPAVAEARILRGPAEK